MGTFHLSDIWGRFICPIQKYRKMQKFKCIKSENPEVPIIFALARDTIAKKVIFAYNYIWHT